MSTVLYVGNLSDKTSAETLRGLFSQVGTVVEVQLPIDRETGRWRGFAFVTMSTAQESHDALRTLGGAMVDGHVLVVRDATVADGPPSSSGGGGGGHGGGGGGRGGDRGPRGRDVDRDGDGVTDSDTDGGNGKD